MCLCVGWGALTLCMLCSSTATVEMEMSVVWEQLFSSLAGITKTHRRIMNRVYGRHPCHSQFAYFDLFFIVSSFLGLEVRTWHYFKENHPIMQIMYCVRVRVRARACVCMCAGVYPCVCSCSSQPVWARGEKGLVCYINKWMALRLHWDAVAIDRCFTATGHSLGLTTGRLR